MQIRTEFWARPIPLRQFDWSAVTDNYEPGCPIGYGRTREEAIADLQEQLEDALAPRTQDNPHRLLPPTRAQWLDECLVEATERAYELRVRFHNGEVVAQFFNHDFPCYTRRFQVGRSS